MTHSKQNFCIFLCGDVMTGRGIDQILPHPNKPQLYESYLTNAQEYVYLAETAHGKISYPVAMDYIWGDALSIWEQMRPQVKVINLETAITQSDDYWPRKGIHYRMHPLNIEVLTTAGINVCTLANNHILDWDQIGLQETIKTLQSARIKFSGAGKNITQAMQPAILKLSPNNRVLIFSAGFASSGIPPTWAATTKTPGLYYLSDISPELIKNVLQNITQYKQAGDLIVFSIHWGSNWGYEISDAFRFFAYQLIDHAGVDIIFGHSSHHPRPIEIYHDKPILYGCGDFINDYEGISGYEAYRDDLSLMYFLEFNVASLKLAKLTLIPLQIKKFSLHRTTEKDSEWLLQLINRIAVNAQFILSDQRMIWINKT